MIKNLHFLSSLLLNNLAEIDIWDLDILNKVIIWDFEIDPRLAISIFYSIN